LARGNNIFQAGAIHPPPTVGKDREEEGRVDQKEKRNRESEQWKAGVKTSRYTEFKVREGGGSKF